MTFSTLRSPLPVEFGKVALRLTPRFLPMFPASIPTNRASLILPQPTHFRRDFYIVFGMTDSSGLLVTDNSNRLNQTFTGQLMVFTSTASGSGQPSIRILFRSTKSQSFTQAGISLFQTSPAKSTTRDLIKQLEKMKF